MTGCTRGPQPHPYDIHFIGAVRLYRAQDGTLEPAYEVGRPLALRFEPGSAGRDTCNPFAGGSLNLRFLDPSGTLVTELTLPATGDTFRRAGENFVLAPVPAGTDGGEPGRTAPIRLPDAPGRWTLDVTWRCAGGTATRRTVHHFRCHRNPLHRPNGDPFWQALADSVDLPASALVETYDRALETASSPADRLWIVRALFQAYKSAGDYASAEAAASEWAKLAAAADYPSEAVLAWNAAHEAARASGDLERALRYLDQSMKLAADLEYTVRLPESWYSRAELLSRSGRPVEAIAAAREARRHAQANAKTLFATGADLKELELLQAMGHHRIVNERLDRDYTGNPARRPPIANNIGWLILRGVEAGVPLHDRKEEALDQAEAAFRHALAGFQAQGNIAEEANTLANLAETAFLRGDIGQARDLLARARSFAPARDGVLQPFMTWLDAEILRAEKALPEALQTYDRLEAMARDRQSAEYAGRAAFGKGSVLAARGELPQAIEAFDQALEWIEEDAAIRSPLHEASVLSNRPLWEEAAVLARLDLGLNLPALEVVEHGTWARRQSLTRSARRIRLDDATRAAVSRLQQVLDRLDSDIIRLQHLPRTQDNLERLREEEETRQSRWAELEMKLGTARRGPAPSLSLEAIRERVPASSVVLRPASFPHELVIWAIDDTGLHVRRLPVPRARLETLCLRFAESCRMGHPDGTLGVTLASILLGNLEDDPPAHLVLVTEGPLRLLPWNALPAGGKRLIDRTVCHYRTTLLPLQQRPSPASSPPEHRGAPPTNDVLIVADPTRDLPVSAREGRRLLERFPGATLLLRDEATREAVTRALEEASLFHYAGHGVTNQLSPYLSHLLLAGGERLSLMEIRALVLNGPSVFLNACEAGQVATEGGGVVGIADSFVAAGARTVIAGRWDVPDRVAFRVALEYYRHTLEPHSSCSAAEALTATLRALRQDNGAEGPPLDSAAWSAYLVLEGP